MYIVYIRTFICIHTYTHTLSLPLSIHISIYISQLGEYCKSFFVEPAGSYGPQVNPFTRVKNDGLFCQQFLGDFFFCQEFSVRLLYVCIYIYIYIFFPIILVMFLYIFFLPTISGDVVVFGTFKSIIYRKKPLGF